MKVEIRGEEIQALDVLMEDAKVPIKMGMVLGLFRVRIQEELIKEQEKRIKEKYIPDKKAKK